MKLTRYHVLPMTLMITSQKRMKSYKLQNFPEVLKKRQRVIQRKKREETINNSVSKMMENNPFHPSVVFHIETMQ